MSGAGEALDHRAAFAFFGRRVEVRSDDPGVVDALAAVYERMRVPLEGSPNGHAAADDAVDVAVAVRARHPKGPRIAFGGRTVRVARPEQLSHYAHLVLVNAAAAQAEALVLHAGAVARAGRAVVLVGSSGAGKSTLTLELVRRGWDLLSDDFAVLRPDGIVEPFPRRVNATAHTLALLGAEAPPGSIELVGGGGRTKWLINPEALYPGRLGGPTPLGPVFLLGAEEHSGGGAGPWELEVDRAPAGFVADLAALPGVRRATVREAADGPPAVAVDAQPGTRLVADLDAVAARHDVAVLGARQGGPAAEARWGEAPVASPIAPDEALPALLSHALSLSGRRFLAGTQPADVLGAMAHARSALRRSGATAYRLQPGALAATADRVERLASEG